MAIPEFVLGTAQLTTNYGITRASIPAQDYSSANATLACASTLGITTVDTAPAYGEAESVIGTSSIPFFVHTKASRGHDEVESLRESLVRLGTDVVDVFYVHDVVAFAEDPAGTIRRMSRCLAEGARKIGVSVYDEHEFEIALQFPEITAIQFPLNLFDRRFSGRLLGEAVSRGMSCYARSVFLQGVLLEHPNALEPRVKHLADAVSTFSRRADDLNICREVASLGWVANHPELTGVVVGAANSHQVTQLAAYWKDALQLDRGVIKAFEDATSDVPGADPRRWS